MSIWRSESTFLLAIIESGSPGQLSSARAAEFDGERSQFSSRKFCSTQFYQANLATRILRDRKISFDHSRHCDGASRKSQPRCDHEAAIKSGNESLLERVELFDLFMVPAGGNLDARRKSLAYSLTLSRQNRTLTK